MRVIAIVQTAVCKKRFRFPESLLLYNIQFSRRGRLSEPARCASAHRRCRRGRFCRFRGHRRGLLRSARRSRFAHEQDGCAGGVEFADYVEYLLDEDGRKAHGRFIQHQQLRLAIMTRGPWQASAARRRRACRRSALRRSSRAREAAVAHRLDVRIGETGFRLRVCAHLQVLAEPSSAGRCAQPFRHLRKTSRSTSL